MPEEAVPTWSGDPSEFEHFATACRWYVKSLKESERRQAAPRKGAAKAVVRHLNPDKYERAGGLQKLLQVLRDSPLQQGFFLQVGEVELPSPPRWRDNSRASGERRGFVYSVAAGPPSSSW